MIDPAARLHTQALVDSMTSASDRLDYRQVCAQAAHDDAAFSSFRRHPAYRKVLEHFSAADGAAYLEEIRAAYPWLIPHMPLFAGNDAVGGAETVEYQEIPSISASTLRYVKHLGEMVTLFGSLDGKEIVEIGGGYGGLCRLVLAQYPTARYTLMDLPDALALAARYIQCFGEGIRGRTRLLPLSEMPNAVAFDLVISNCAFSECVPTVQESYISRVLAHAGAGYLLCNRKPEAYPRAVIIEKLRGLGLNELRTIEERPRTAPGNIVVVWGTQSRSAPIGLPYPLQRAMFRAFPVAFLGTVNAYRRVRRTCRPLRRRYTELRAEIGG